MIDPALYRPSPWHVRFHQSSAEETMGGGSAGPGKSLGLLWDPIVLQAYVEHARCTGQGVEEQPEWIQELIKRFPISVGESSGNALHMRRSFPQLKETIDRAVRMFPKFDPGVKYSKDDHRFTFTSGYKVTFGHCLLESDTQNYLSQQYTWLGLDEGWQFTKNQYDELDSRVRSSDAILRPLKRTRIMTNPAPGWIKERFYDPAPEGNTMLKRKVVDPESGKFKWKTLLFLPAKLDDNPDKDFVEDYKFKLLAKPHHIRARYLYGDWDSQEGGYYEDDWNPAVHVIEPFKIPRDWPKFRSMDWGYKAPGVIGWWAMDPRNDDLYLFYEFNFRLMKADEVALRAIDIEKQFGFWDMSQRCSRLNGVADTQLWEERGDTGRSKAAEFIERGMFWQGADKGSMQRNAERLCALLRDYDDKRPPALRIFKNCKETRKMFSGIQIDKNDSTVPDKKSKLKHWFDMAGYGAAHASRGAKAIVMQLHAFDRDYDDDLEPEAAESSGGFGYGS